MLQRVWAYSRALSRNSRDYLINILRWEQDPIAEKTAGFLERNFRRTRKVTGGVFSGMGKARGAMQHMVQQFRQFADDSKYFAKAKKDQSLQKYSKFTYTEHHKVQRVKGDMIKMIPFSVLLIIPGFELFIPAWVAAFPSAIPSQFQSEAKQEEQFKRMLEKREHAAKNLRRKLGIYFNNLIKDKLVNTEDIEPLNHLKSLMRDKGADPIELLSYKSLFRRYVGF